MTRENSNIQPLRSLVELDHKGYAYINLVDPASVQESTDDDGNTVYEYDRYTISRRCAANQYARLKSVVANNFAAWLDMAKAEDAAGQQANTATEADRLAAVETKTATHDVEIEQIVTGLEALSNGG